MLETSNVILRFLSIDYDKTQEFISSFLVSVHSLDFSAATALILGSNVAHLSSQVSLDGLDRQ